MNTKRELSCSLQRAELSKKGGIRVLARFIVEHQRYEQLKLKCVMPAPLVSSNGIAKISASNRFQKCSPVSRVVRYSELS